MRPRRAEPRIVDPATHPRRYVSVAVAAEYLEVDRKTFSRYLDKGLVAFTTFGSRRKVLVVDLVEFEQRQRVPAFHAQRETGEKREAM